MKHFLSAFFIILTVLLLGCKDSNSNTSQKDYTLAVVCHDKILEFKITEAPDTTSRFTLHIHAYQQQIPAQTRIFLGDQLLVETNQETSLLEIPLPNLPNPQHTTFKISFNPYSPLHTITVNGTDLFGNHCHCSDPSCHAHHH